MLTLICIPHRNGKEVETILQILRNTNWLLPVVVAGCQLQGSDDAGTCGGSRKLDHLEDDSSWLEDWLEESFERGASSRAVHIQGVCNCLLPLRKIILNFVIRSTRPFLTMQPVKTVNGDDVDSIVNPPTSSPSL